MALRIMVASVSGAGMLFSAARVGIIIFCSKFSADRCPISDFPVLPADIFTRFGFMFIAIFSPKILV
jgi:hypothetical protein